MEKSLVVNKTDTLQLIQSFVYGLWSLDSGNILYNKGYYFREEGDVDFVAEEVSGKWQLTSRDSMEIVYTSFRQEYKAEYKIDSISESEMILSDSSGKHLFRKVPFGMNPEGNVLQGFSGNLEPGEDKNYTFDIPSAKKMELRLKTDNPAIVFRVFEGTNEITSIPVHHWTAIMIRSGKYKVTISNPQKGKNSEFDLKVLAY
jgi:hypothetical protein